MDNELLNKIKQLEEELNEIKQHLKKYTAPKRSKTYYENHKDEILQRSCEKFICECGSICSVGHRARHFKSKKHNHNINVLTDKT